MKPKPFFALLGVLMLVTACAADTTNIDTMGMADPFQKTITAPGGAGKLTDKVKAMIVNDNWRMTDTNGRPLAQPRYTIKLKYDEVDVCMPKLEPKYDYEVVIVDNRTGGPTFQMHGHDCEHVILDHLNDFLLGRKP